MSTQAVDYPPRVHLLRDLRISIERGEESSRASLELTPHLCGEHRGVRAGVLATLVDVIAGERAARAVAPDWIATCDLVLHLVSAADRGTIRATPSVLRRGRSTVVIEVALECEEPAGGHRSIGLATVTFSVLQARGEIQSIDDAADGAFTRFALPETCLDRPLLDKLELRRVDPPSGGFELPLTPYVSNSLGALQGGALALLVDLAAEGCGRQGSLSSKHAALRDEALAHGRDHGSTNGAHRRAASGGPLGGTETRRDWVTTDFAIHYLALGRHGPFRSRARLLRLDDASALARVEVRDAGAEDRLVAVATATAEKLAVR